MSYRLTGKLHKVFPTESKTESFQAREFIVLVEDGNYPQYVKFQLVQDRCLLIDNYTTGQRVTVHFDLRGREWEGKYFTNLNAWRIDEAWPEPAREPEKEQEPAGEAEEEAGEKDDDLPF